MALAVTIQVIKCLFQNMMGKGSLFLGFTLVLIQSNIALVTKNFQKYKVKANSVANSTELAFIPQMDFSECAYFCMKETQNNKSCHAFYITKKGSCRKVDPDPCYEKISQDDSNSMIMYSTKTINIIGELDLCFSTK